MAYINSVNIWKKNYSHHHPHPPTKKKKKTIWKIKEYVHAYSLPNLKGKEKQKAKHKFGYQIIIYYKSDC